MILGAILIAAAIAFGIVIRAIAGEAAEEDKEEMEEQERYLEEWKKRKNNKKEEGKGKIEWGKGLPKESGKYVCITKFGEVHTYEYSKVYKMFNTADNCDYETAVSTCINEYILCWVPIEEFLKSQGFKRKEIKNGEIDRKK